MRIDVHVRLCALPPGHGSMSAALYRSVPFRFMRWRLGIRDDDLRVDESLERKLTELLDATPELDAALVLAFDAVHRRDGSMDLARTCT